MKTTWRFSLDDLRRQHYSPAEVEKFLAIMNRAQSSALVNGPSSRPTSGSADNAVAFSIATQAAPISFILRWPSSVKAIRPWALTKAVCRVQWASAILLISVAKSSLLGLIRRKANQPEQGDKKS